MTPYYQRKFVVKVDCKWHSGSQTISSAFIRVTSNISKNKLNNLSWHSSSIQHDLCWRIHSQSPMYQEPQPEETSWDTRGHQTYLLEKKDGKEWQGTKTHKQGQEKALVVAQDSEDVMSAGCYSLTVLWPFEILCLNLSAHSMKHFHILHNIIIHQHKRKEIVAVFQLHNMM